MTQSRFAVLICLLTAILSPRTQAQNWTPVPEIPSGFINDITGVGGLLFAANDSLVFRTSDGGATWQPTETRPPSYALNALFIHDGHVYAGTRGNGVFVSADTGRTWSDETAGISAAGKFITAFAVRGDSIFAATDGGGVFVRSLIQGAAWSAFNSGLTQYGSTSIDAFGPSVFACIGAYVFRHTWGDDAWTAMSADSFHSAIPLHVLSMEHGTFVGTSGGIFRMMPDSMHWEKADIKQFAGRTIPALAADGERLYAGLDYRGEHWIFFTVDDGAVWDIFAHEFAQIVALHVGANRLWAARGDGLWWFPLSPASAVAPADAAHPSAFVMDNVFPNPFNPVATIRFTLTEADHVTIRAADAQGRDVAVISDRTYAAGGHAVRWDAGGLASGTYFVTVRTAGGSRTRIAVLLK